MTPITELERQNIANNKEKPVTEVNQERKKMTNSEHLRGSVLMGFLIYAMVFLILVVPGFIGGIGVTTPESVVSSGIAAGICGLFGGSLLWYWGHP